MKAALKVGLSLVAVLGFLALAQADDKKDETLKGTITCAKCDLDIAKDGKITVTNPRNGFTKTYQARGTEPGY